MEVSNIIFDKGAKILHSKEDSIFNNAVAKIICLHVEEQGRIHTSHSVQ